MITLEIDCSPDSNRPDDIYDDIIDEIKDSQMNNVIKQFIPYWEDKEPITKNCGSWIWELYECLSKDNRDELRTFILNKLIGYHYTNTIRYGSID
jgi:hypothetical protein